MSDLACWAMPEHNGYVLRIHGSEHFITDDELAELDEMLVRIGAGQKEVLGEGYLELQADREAQVKQEKGGLLARLGLQRIPAIKRRSL